MGSLHFVVVSAAASLLLMAAFDGALVHADFYNDVDFVWGYQNAGIWNDGNSLSLMLDNVSGLHRLFPSLAMSGFIQSSPYPALMFRLWDGDEEAVSVWEHRSADQTGEGELFGHCNSLSSTGDEHDEIDFEFLGNETGQPYIIHTNIFTQGVGNREEQFYPWFDPSADFHNYTIHWNPSQVVNYESYGVPFPNRQAMRAYSSIWEADEWTTRGGLVKIDWKSAPFVAYYQYLQLRACPWYGPSSSSECSAASPANWWASPEYSTLTYQEQGQMNWVRDNYMIYDYCKDTERFYGATPPPECSLPKY
ncbi:hypothetical protein BHM03_00004262 [Ensete ventricosum]|uniref:Xyloglucan endotransglucosylase/hydrolase n=1 Tax=Ensete ventricosum TaxID=4639 RepID=A0A445MAI5_ENSVE|nr:hypothetical protein BHM03_00004262 [Ensete ventricosum]